MEITVCALQEFDLPDAIELWNHVVDEGKYFPQEFPLNETTGKEFFLAQTYVGIVKEAEDVLGFYILHPNNVGRCSHSANASYAVAPAARGKGVGRLLVEDSLIQAKSHGFSLMQFNAVVASNTAAIHLYKSLGFTPLGEIPNGFRNKEGAYENIIPFFKVLT